MKYSIIILALVSFSLSCKTKKQIAEKSNPTTDTMYMENPETGELHMIIGDENILLPEGDWTLQAIGEDMESEMSRIFLTINTKDKLASGNDGCNQYSGQLKTLNNINISFSPLASTKRACIVPARFAQPFYNAMQQVRSYTATVENLILKDIQGNQLLRFVKKEN